jgi:hypothetical protein
MNFQEKIIKNKTLVEDPADFYEVPLVNPRTLHHFLQTNLYRSKPCALRHEP